MSSHTPGLRDAFLIFELLRLTEEYSHGREESVLLWLALHQGQSSAQMTYMARKYRARSCGDDAPVAMFFLSWCVGREYYFDRRWLLAYVIFPLAVMTSWPLRTSSSDLQKREISNTALKVGVVTFHI